MTASGSFLADTAVGGAKARCLSSCDFFHRGGAGPFQEGAGHGF